jgi:SAM-dependent methyltransferase
MNEQVNINMSEFWNGRGGENWVKLQDHMDIFLQEFGQQALDIANIQEGEFILDIGCGCGNTTFDIAQKVGSSGHVLGQDISEPIIGEAYAKMVQAGVENVTFRCGDAQIFDFEPNLFSLAFSRFGVMFFDNPIAAFGNIRSAIESGGRLAFACWQPAQKNQWVRVGLDIVSKHIELPAPPGKDEPGPFSFGDPERVRHILTEAGFTDIIVTAVHAPLLVGQTPAAASFFMTNLGPAASAIAKSEADSATIAAITADLRGTLGAHDSGNGVILEGAAWVVSARNP